MKTIKVSPQERALQALLKRASQENLILRAPDGREFIVAELDDFDREIELQRQNKEFMRFLDERGREPKKLAEGLDYPQPTGAGAAPEEV